MNARHDGINFNTSDIDALLAGVGSRTKSNIAGQGDADGKTVERQDGLPAGRLDGGPLHRQADPTAQQQDSKSASRRSAENQPPTRSKFTALLDYTDALAFDELAYQLRAHTGRRVEKSEILRTLIHLGLTHPETTAALGAALDRRRSQPDQPSKS